MGGKKPPWADDDQRLQTALELARRPLNGSSTGGYGDAITAVQKAFDTMNELQGDELRRYADLHFTSKPELIEALTKLQNLQSQARPHFSRVYLRHPQPGAAA